MSHAALSAMVAVAQMRTTPKDVRGNLTRALAYIKEARRVGAKIVVFPELCLSGYMLGDYWEDDEFIKEIERANHIMCSASEGLVVVWGSVQADWQKLGEDGRVRKYNAAFIAQDGALVSNGLLEGWIPKTNMPKYRIFDDERHFYSATKYAEELGVKLKQLLTAFTVTIDGIKIKLGLLVCEDGWDNEYNAKPAKIYGAHGIDLLIDISQSPWTAGKWHAREGMLKARAQDAGCPVLYVNSIGLQNNTKNLVWFDGFSAAVNSLGTLIWQAPQHKEGLFTYHFAAHGNPLREPVRPQEGDEILDALIAAKHEFYTPFPRVVSGLSGGIDSAVDVALNVLALGPEKVLAINMPTWFNSRTTKQLAKLCASNLGIEYIESPIQTTFEREMYEIELAGKVLSALDKENLQAVIRGLRLNMFAKSVGGVFTCNGNKTEVALNYFTLYGDGAGAAAFLADLWKGQIYDLARLINSRAGRDLIPQEIIDIVPSAELSAEQNVDEGKGDPIFYPFHDKLLRSWVERRGDITSVLGWALDGSLEKKLGCIEGTVARYFGTREGFVKNLEWAWTQYNTEYKRHQLPPVFLASRRAFGFDRRDTIASVYFTTEYYRLRELYLRQVP